MIHEGDLEINSGETSLVTEVTGDCNIRKGAKVPNLESVGGTCDIYEGAKVPNLKTVGVHCWIYEGAKVPKLKSVGGHWYIREGANAPNLKSVGGGCIIYEGVKVPKLKTVGRYCYIYEGAKAPNLYANGYTGVTGRVYDKNLTGPHQMRGKTLHFEQIDGDTMVVGKWKSQGDVQVCKAKYFSGKPLDEMDKCYVAKSGEYYAHGVSIQKAISDLQFKVLSETGDKSDIVSDIIKSHMVTFNQWRLITGACESGTSQFLNDHDIDPDEVSALSLDKVLDMTKGAYGGDTFAKAIRLGRSS